MQSTQPLRALPLRACSHDVEQPQLVLPLLVHVLQRPLQRPLAGLQTSPRRKMLASPLFSQRRAAAGGWMGRGSTEQHCSRQRFRQLPCTSAASACGQRCEPAPRSCRLPPLWYGPRSPFAAVLGSLDCRWMSGSVVLSVRVHKAAHSSFLQPQCGGEPCRGAWLTEFWQPGLAGKRAPAIPACAIRRALMPPAASCHDL